jgi:hypothetical protein
MKNEINLELKTIYVQSKVVSLVRNPNTGGSYFLDIDIPEHKTKIDRWVKYELTDKDIHIPTDGGSLRSRESQPFFGY